jgi:hypothetical protein
MEGMQMLRTRPNILMGVILLLVAAFAVYTANRLHLGSRSILVWVFIGAIVWPALRRLAR